MAPKSKDPPLNLAGTIKLVEAFIEHVADHETTIFSFIKKKYFPGLNRDLYYDFLKCATAGQYVKNDAQKLVTWEGETLLRQNVSRMAALTSGKLMEALDMNKIADELQRIYLAVDIEMDKAGRIKSSQRLYLKTVGRTASRTQPADRQHFNECNGAGVRRGTGEAGPTFGSNTGAAAADNGEMPPEKQQQQQYEECSVHGCGEVLYAHDPGCRCRNTARCADHIFDQCPQCRPQCHTPSEPITRRAPGAPVKNTDARSYLPGRRGGFVPEDADKAVAEERMGQGVVLSHCCTAAVCPLLHSPTTSPLHCHTASPLYCLTAALPHRCIVSLLGGFVSIWLHRCRYSAMGHGKTSRRMALGIFCTRCTAGAIYSSISLSCLTTCVSDPLCHQGDVVGISATANAQCVGALGHWYL